MRVCWKYCISSCFLFISLQTFSDDRILIGNLPHSFNSERIVLIRTKDGSFTSRRTSVPIDALFERVSQPGFQRLIVGLDIPIRSDEVSLWGTDGLEIYRDFSRSAQNAFIERARRTLSSENVQAIRPIDGLPYVTVPGTPGILNFLLNDKSVISINTEGAGRPLLDESISFIGATTAHSMGYIGSERAIAIIDTGVARNHPMFSGTVVSEGCYSSSEFSNQGSICRAGSFGSTVENSGGPCTDEPACGPGHGSTVAAIAAGKAVTPGGTVPPLKGVAFDANIISLMTMSRVDDNPSICAPSEGQTCYRFMEADVAAALSRVNVLRSSFSISAVNMSIIMGVFSSEFSNSVCDADWPLVRDAVNILVNSGTAVVAASGNAGAISGFMNKIGAPACLSKVTSVAATSRSQDQFQSYANAAPILDLLAPGGGGPFDDSGSSCRDDFVILGGIWSAYFQSVCPDAYLQDAGTSMAAPHVAGAQTLLSIRFPQASATGIRDWIKASGTPISFTQGTQNYTKPRLNLDQALIAPPSPASGPSNATVSPAMCFGINDVSWDSMPDATEYQVQGSLSSTFSSPWTLFRGTSTFITVHVQQPTYIRVRGWNMVSAGPWSVAGQAQYFSSCL